MQGGLVGGIGRVACVVAFIAGLAAALAGPTAAQSNPRAVVYQLIDQLQTGEARPVDLAPAVRQVIAEQTGNTGRYPSLVRLGIVTHVSVDSTTPMQRGTLYALTATHDKGVSTWQVGIAAETQRIEYVEFKIGKASGAPAAEPAKPPQAVTTPPQAVITPPPTATKPLAPRAEAVPQPSHGPAQAPPPSQAPEPAPRMASPAEISAACRKFPNLC